VVVEQEEKVVLSRAQKVQEALNAEKSPPPLIELDLNIPKKK
jgi:hypothetical protein